jgi:RNA polymerase sigma-70 factor (ECF subfamily)
MSQISSGTSDSTSASLIVRVRQCDPVAWQQFADVYTPFVYSLARRGGLRDEDAADLAQDVFRTVAARIDDFGKGHENSSFRGWLWAITRNRLRLHYRRLGKQPQATGGTDAALALAHVPAWLDDDEDPSTAGEQADLVRRMLNVIRVDFDERTWQAFWRSAIDEDSADEIAQDLHMSPGAVRQAKYRVLCRLRDELSGG